MGKSMPIAIAAIVISAVAVVSSAAAIVMNVTSTIGAGSIGITEIVDNSINGDKIIDNSITIQDLSTDVIVELENIADNSITSIKIQDETITSDDIGPDAVGSSEIKDGSVAEVDLTSEVSERLGKVATVIVAADGSGDYTDIQSGIDALPGNGGVVYIKEGTYITDTWIGLTSNVALIGAGSATVIYLADWTETEVIYAGDAENILIADLHINGNRANQTTGDSGISFTEVENSSIRNCWIDHCYSDGIRLDSSNNNTITNNVVGLNGGDGVELQLSDRNSLMGNTVTLNDYCGFCMESSVNNTVSGNVARSNGTDGIYLSSGGNNAVTGNNFKANLLDGVNISASSSNSVTGNVVENNGSSGITMDSSPNNAVSGNTVGMNGQNGIRAVSSNNNVFTGNAVMYNSQVFSGGFNGIYLLNLSSCNVITGNRSGGSSQLYGVSVGDAMCENNVVVGNVLSGNGTGALNDPWLITISANNAT